MPTVTVTPTLIGKKELEGPRQTSRDTTSVHMTTVLNPMGIFQL